MSDISNLRKRRGAIKASTMKLTSRMKQFESKAHESATIELAQQLVPNLNSLDAKYKEHHFSIIDNINEKDEASLAKEQEVLSTHDEEFSFCCFMRSNLFTSALLPPIWGVVKLSPATLPT